MHVVILAAGMGTRLGGDRPKPLTEIAPGLTLLGAQVRVLSELVHEDRITLVLGYAAANIMESFPNLQYVFNPKFAETNTAKSLLCALRKLDDDVLWTNADLYFEEPAARRLLAGRGTRLLVDRSHVGEEEIKYTTHEDGSIAELSKQVREPLGEALGMNVIAKHDLPKFVEQLHAVAAQDYFEKALENLTINRSISATPIAIEHEYCREVDFPADLEAVRAHLSKGPSS